ncbi:MAG: flavodoxin domain-containing protein [Anaerolineales bacterium]|jgi:menaquinone-dependent protoporphyrinogen oxidase
MNILVTYATRTGSTAGVAEAIAQTLIKNGFTADLRPMQVVNDFSNYAAVVAGSAIQNRQWLPEAVQFLQSNRTILRQKPFAMFAVCMTLAMRNGEKYRPSISEWLAPARALVPPASEGLFAGSLDISKIPSLSDRLKFRLSVLFGVWSQGDHRDWDAIHTWAEAIPQKLGLEA